MSNRPLVDRPLCPNCGNRTMLARVASPSNEGSIRVFFDCVSCNRLRMWEVPVQDADGWIAGKLKPYPWRNSWCA
jgi:hypothetical protein